MPKRKLTPEDVVRIRELYSTGQWSIRRIAYEYDVSHITVYRHIRAQVGEGYAGIRGLVDVLGIEVYIIRSVIRKFGITNYSYGAMKSHLYSVQEVWDAIVSIAPYLTIQEVTSQLQITRQRVDQLLAQNKLPLQRVLHGVYHITDFEQWEAVVAERARKGKVGVYIQHTSGRIMGPIYNLAEFCRAYDLHYQCMYNVIHGISKGHRGWFLYTGEDTL